MRILYLSLERNIDLEQYHQVMYLDYSDINRFKDAGDLTTLYGRIFDFQPDLVIEREFNDGKSKYPGIIKWVKENLPKCQTAVWLIDNHCNASWHYDYAPLFDHVFVAISAFKPMLKSKYKDMKIHWLPLCYPLQQKRIVRNKGHIDYDVVFVGRWGKWFPERTDLIRKLQARYGNEFFTITDYANMEENLRKGIISFNRSLSSDMNFRVWESLANGVELVTNDVPDLHLIKGLPDKINIYHDEDELFTLIDAIVDGELANDVIKNQIWVQNHHCLIHRHQAMLEMISSGNQMEF